MNHIHEWYFYKFLNLENTFHTFFQCIIAGLFEFHHSYLIVIPLYGASNFSVNSSTVLRYIINILTRWNVLISEAAMGYNMKDKKTVSEFVYAMKKYNHNYYTIYILSLGRKNTERGNKPNSYWILQPRIYKNTLLRIARRVKSRTPKQVCFGYFQNHRSLVNVIYKFHVGKFNIFFFFKRSRKKQKN